VIASLIMVAGIPYKFKTRSKETKKQKKQPARRDASPLSPQ
jgi:hypothetical protein